MPVCPDIVFTTHALDRMRERGATRDDVQRALREGSPQPGKQGRAIYRLELDYFSDWGGRFYAKRQVAPVVVEENDTITVITVYVFYN